MPLTDPVAHLRESLHGWITSAPEDVIRALVKVRRNLDSNLKKPAPPAGWRPLFAVAQENGLSTGHLARICRDIYSAQELARICTVKGRLTWCLSPEACATLAPVEHEAGSAIDPQNTSATAAPSGENQRSTFGAPTTRNPGEVEAAAITGATSAPTDRTEQSPALEGGSRRLRTPFGARSSPESCEWTALRC